LEFHPVLLSWLLQSAPLSVSLPELFVVLSVDESGTNPASLVQVLFPVSPIR
jgi:hypothetical protein